MIDVSDAVRNKYKTDRYPLSEELAKKEFFIKLLESGTVITEDNLESENFTLTESICSDTNITFGACEASMVSFAVYNISEELNNKWIEIYQTVDGEKVPFGTYRISTVTKRDADPNWRDIVAYDRMTELDVEVVSWWDSFWETRESTTVKEFRTAFFSYMGFDTIYQELPNDGLTFKKTIDPESIKGRYIAQEIGEINGCFGHFTREDKFKYISLSSLSLYPSEDLLPSETLFPAESTEILAGDTAIYFASESHFEDYMVKAIDSVTFRESDESSGYTVGDTQDNPYIIEGNFLVYNKTNAELSEIADNFLLMSKNKTYTPNTTVMIGLPYLEVGDSVSVVLDKDAFDTFIFERTLTGIANLMDEITATGTEYRRDESSGDSTELLVLKSTVAQNTEDIEQNTADIEQNAADIEATNENLTEVSEDVSELEETVEEVSVTLQQTSEGLEAEVKRAKEAEAKLKLTADGLSVDIKAAQDTADDASDDASSAYSLALSAYNGLSSKVSKGDVVSEIEQTSEKITLQANALEFEGGNFLVDENGNIVIGGSFCVLTESYICSGNVSDANAIVTYDGRGACNIALSGTTVNFSGATVKNLTANSATKANSVVTSDGTALTGIGTVSSANSISYCAVRYIRINNANTPYTITLNAQWGTSSYAGHNIVSASSDIRLKTNIIESEVDARSIVNKMGVVAFDWIKDGAHQDIGFIADELEDIDPRFTVGGGYDEDGSPNYKAIDTLYLCAYLTKAMQQQDKEIETLKSENMALQCDIAILKKEMEELKCLVTSTVQ